MVGDLDEPSLRHRKRGFVVDEPHDSGARVPEAMGVLDRVVDDGALQHPVPRRRKHDHPVLHPATCLSDAMAALENGLQTTGILVERVARIIRTDPRVRLAAVVDTQHVCWPAGKYVPASGCGLRIRSCARDPTPTVQLEDTFFFVGK